MRTSKPILASKLTRIIFRIVAPKQANNPIDPSINWVVITTSSLSFETLFTGKYTISYDGVINIISTRLDMLTFNDANGECKLQMSGDGGNTFVDVTNEVPGAATSLWSVGPGEWVNNVQIGPDKFQIRLLGRSTDGNPTGIYIHPVSAIDIIFSKKLL